MLDLPPTPFDFANRSADSERIVVLEIVCRWFSSGPPLGSRNYDKSVSKLSRGDIQ